MSVKICPEGGFSLSTTLGEEVVETRLRWCKSAFGGEIEIRVNDERQLNKVFTLLTNTLGGGLQIEFDGHEWLMQGSKELFPYQNGNLSMAVRRNAGRKSK